MSSINLKTIHLSYKFSINKIKSNSKEINEKYSDRIIDIAGYDTSFIDKYNLDLGLKRANKIVDKMMS